MKVFIINHITTPPHHRPDVYKSPACNDDVLSVAAWRRCSAAVTLLPISSRQQKLLVAWTSNQAVEKVFYFSFGNFTNEIVLF